MEGMPARPGRLRSPDQKRIRASVAIGEKHEVVNPFFIREGRKGTKQAQEDRKKEKSNA